jgi:N utilization substance protein B
MNLEEQVADAPKPHDILTRNVQEFAPDTQDTPYMKRLLDGVLQKQSDLDAVITKAAPEWPLEKIARVDRNILRIGLYELLFADRSEVPAKVAINEAIELGKNFGGESSGRFINGVLGSVYKELGEPGKEETSKNKHKQSQRPLVPYEKMPIERKGGAVVYANHENDVYVALVHDVFGHWTLPKGGIEDAETAEEGTTREILQELNLTATVVEKLGENEYVASNPEKGKIRKHVTYFLMESPFTEVKLEEKGGLDDARWFKLAAILELNFYHDILPIITKAINILLNPKDSK